MNVETLFKGWFWSGLVCAMTGLAGFFLYFKYPVLLDVIVDPVGDQVSGVPVRLSSVCGADILSQYLIGTILILLYFYKIKYWKFESKLVFGLGMSLLFFANFLTFARSFFVCIIVLVVLALNLSKSRDWLRIGAVWGLILAMVAAWAIPSIWNIFPVEIQRDDANQKLGIQVSTKYSYPRVSVYYPGDLRSIRNNPLWGNGVGHRATGPIKLGDRDFPDGADGHNIFLQLWATRGIFGLILYLSFWAMVIIGALKKYRGQAMPLVVKTVFAIVVGMMLAGLTVDIEEKRHLYIMLGLLAGFSSKTFPVAPPGDGT